MVANTGPLCLNMEHLTDGAFDALTCQLGQVRRFWIDPDDETIVRGEVAIPLWLDPNLDVKGLSVEIPFDKTRFIGCALTYAPRVSQAALMNACATFAKEKKRHDTWVGQWQLQDIHDQAARCGAVCQDKANNSTFAAKHEVKAMQAIHDLAVEHGAKCDTGEIAESLWSEDPATTPTPTEKTIPMKASELLKSLFAGFKTSGLPIEDDLNLDTTTSEQVAETKEAPKEPATATDFADQIAAFAKREAALKAELAALKTAQEAKEKAEAEAEAATFAKTNEAAIDRLIAEKKVKPADKAAHMADRAKDPELYDRLAAQFTPAPSVAGLVAAEKVYQEMLGNPDLATKVQATTAYLREQIDYQPW